MNQLHEVGKMPNYLWMGLSNEGRTFKLLLESETAAVPTNFYQQLKAYLKEFPTTEVQLLSERQSQQVQLWVPKSLQPDFEALVEHWDDHVHAMEEEGRNEQHQDWLETRDPGDENPPFNEHEEPAFESSVWVEKKEYDQVPELDSTWFTLGMIGPNTVFKFGEAWGILQSEKGAVEHG